MIKAISYIRVSVCNDTSSLYSTETQRDIIKTYASRNEIEIINEYVDENVSGGNKNRSNLIKAIAEAKKNKAVLIVKDLSRLSRTSHECLRIMSELEVIDCTLGMKADDKVMMMMALMADWEKQACSTRQKQTYEYLRKIDPSRNFGNPASLDKAREVSNRVKKDKANEFAMRLAPLVMTDEKLIDVAMKLTGLGIKTQRGKDRWTAKGVSRLRKRIEEIDVMR